MKFNQATRKNNAFYVPDSSRDDLPRHFKNLGFKVGAEIGVYAGVYTEKFLKEDLEMYGVDPWIAYSGMGRTFEKQGKMNKIRVATKERLSGYKKYHVIKLNSMEAVNKFKDNFLDFVYIDGNHDFRHIAEDLYEWTKKVRFGGIVSGHDYIQSSPRARNVVIHVRPVVDAFVKFFKKKLYIIGEDKDNIPSWMFIKK